VIDFAAELTAWLRSTDARTLMKEIVAEAVQTEIRNALEDELIDVERAAAMLDMTARFAKLSNAVKFHVSASAIACAFAEWICCAERAHPLLHS